MDVYDVIIVGGGPAGLSAALILGRCLRTVLLCDNGKQRNRVSNGLHGYLTRDGMPPAEFLETGRKELTKYETVSIYDGEVTHAGRKDELFEITLQSGEIKRSRKLLLATGVFDELPKIPGILKFWGKSVHQCPYCDGWESRGKKIAVYGKGQRGVKLSRSLLTWSRDVILCTDGDPEFAVEDRENLTRDGIKIIDHKIDCLAGEGEQLQKIIFDNGEELARDVLFFNTSSFLRSRLLDQLGCPYTEEEGVETGKYEKTKVPGLFVAGNILREVQLVIVAAAQGAEAAFGINTSLCQESSTN